MPRESATSLADQRRKLEAKLRAIKAKEAEQANHRFVVAGRAVLAHAENDPAFRDQLHTILAAQVTSKRDRALFDLDGGEVPTAGGDTPATARPSFPSSP